MNTCETMHERIGKCLSKRLGEKASKNLSVEELTSFALIVSIFCEETKRVCGKAHSGNDIWKFVLLELLIES